MLSIIKIFQPFLLFGLVFTLFWSLYRVIYKKDEPIGLILFVSLQIIVDSYLNTAIYIPGMEAGSIRYSEVLLIIIYLKYYRDKLEKIEPKIFWLLFIYFSLFFIASLRGRVFFSGISYFRGAIFPQICTVYLAFKSITNKDDYERFYFYLSILLIFMGLFVFWDKFFDIIWLKSTSLSEPIYWLNRGNDRYGSFFLNPNMYGAFIVLIIFNVFTAFIATKEKVKKIILLGGTLLTLLGLVLTHSRGPMLSFAVAIFAYMILPNRKFPFRTRFLSLIIAFCLLFILMPGFFESATNRFTEEETAASESLEEVSRLSIWIGTVELIQKYPFFGIGLGEDQYRYKMSRETDFRQKYHHVLDNPHSSYLHMAVMTGSITLIVFLLLNFIILLRAIKSLLKSDSQSGNIYTPGIIAGVSGFLISLIVDQSMFTKVAPVYWMLIGFLYCITSKKQHDN